MYDGTRGNGKSEALLIDFYTGVGQGFGAAWQGIIFRREYKELNNIVKRSKKLFATICPGAKFKEALSEYKWVFPDGEELMLRAAKNEADYWSYHGDEIPWLGFEELVNSPDDGFYLAMHSCCRSTEPGMPRRVRATTNPYGVGHHWVKRRFVDPMNGKDIAVITDEVTGRDRARVKGYWWENNHLVDNDPEYIRTLFADPNEARRKAWTEGDWDIVSGGMFGDVWDRHTNILPAIDVREFLKAGWKLDRSFDWGSSSPFSVGWWAESNGRSIQVGGEQRTFPKKSLIRFAEWYGCDKKKPNTGLRMLSEDIARGILDREGRMGLAGQIKPGPADNSIHNFTEGDSVAQKMGRVGVRWTPSDKSKGSRKNGWEIMRGMMQAAHPIDDRGERIPVEDPALYSTENCTDFNAIIPAAPRDDDDLDDVDTDSEDHIPDEVRYRVTLRKTGSIRAGRVGGT